MTQNTNNNKRFQYTPPHHPTFGTGGYNNNYIKQSLVNPLAIAEHITNTDNNQFDLIDEHIDTFITVAKCRRKIRNIKWVKSFNFLIAKDRHYRNKNMI